MTSTDQERATASSDPDDIEAQIERHREELSETVEELVDRVNVKARAQRRVAETKQRVVSEVDRSRRELRSGDPARVASALAPLAVVVAVGALVVYWSKRRS